MAEFAHNPIDDNKNTEISYDEKEPDMIEPYSGFKYPQYQFMKKNSNDMDSVSTQNN